MRAKKNWLAVDKECKINDDESHLLSKTCNSSYALYT